MKVCYRIVLKHLHLLLFTEKPEVKVRFLKHLGKIFVHKDTSKIIISIFTFKTLCISKRFLQGHFQFQFGSQHWDNLKLK